MPLPALSPSTLIDAGGVSENKLSLANNMSPTNRELRAIRIGIELLLSELSGRDVDLSQFTSTEALEG